MGKPLDLTGMKFGRLTATELLGSINSKRYWAVTCDCGNEEIVQQGNLTNGKSKSCGCFNLENIRMKGKNQTHGATHSVEYRAWQNVKARSQQPCVDEWNSFEQFLSDIGKKPSAAHYLSRHDAREPHGPNNTYWRHPNEDERLRNLTHLDLGPEFFCDMRAISRANQAIKERARTEAGILR